MPTARNGGQVVRSIENFKADEIVGLAPVSSENAVLSPHTNVHQGIKKDRIGYVRISLDLCCKCLNISILYPDSDPHLQVKRLGFNGLGGFRGVTVSKSVRRNMHPPELLNDSEVLSLCTLSWLPKPRYPR